MIYPGSRENGLIKRFQIMEDFKNFLELINKMLCYEKILIMFDFTKLPLK